MSAFPVDAAIALAGLIGDPGDGTLDWMDRALCTETDPELFFPTTEVQTTREAKRICMACDVRAECLAYALAGDIPHGIWGGMSDRDRRRMRRARAGERAA